MEAEEWPRTGIGDGESSGGLLFLANWGGKCVENTRSWSDGHNGVGPGYGIDEKVGRNSDNKRKYGNRDLLIATNGLLYDPFAMTHCKGEMAGLSVGDRSVGSSRIDRKRMQVLKHGS